MYFSFASLNAKWFLVCMECRTEYSVIITNKMDGSENSLEITLFVLTSDGSILSRDALQQAIDV